MILLPGLSAIWRGAALAVGLAAVVPVRGGDLSSRASPASSYASAVERAMNMIASDDSVVAPGGGSILLTHGTRTARAVVLLHGFTNSPRQFAALADSLFAAGDNVFVPRLPRHALRGKSVGELAALTAAELCRATDAAIDIAAGLGDSVITLGLSVGGTLSLWAAERRHEVRRAVVIAPPFEANAVPSMLSRALVNLGARAPNVSRRATADTTRPDRLPGFTTRALAQVLRLGMAVRRDASEATPLSPEVLFVVNARDRTVKAAAVVDVARAWTRRGAPASLYEVPDSLALPHNVVDPVEPNANAALLLPAFVALVHGESPGDLIHTRR